MKSTKTGRVSRTWAQRIRLLDGRLVNRGLGPFPKISLSHARKLAAANVRAVAEGRDPFAVRVPTVAACLPAVLKLQRATWREGSKTERIWTSNFNRHVVPKLGGLRIDQVTTGQCLEVVGPLWDRPQLGKRVRGVLRNIMAWAIAQNYRADDPAGERLAACLPKKARAAGVVHRPALRPPEVPGALSKVHSSDGWLGAKLCIEFQTLTASRPSEARLLTWSEIQGDVWELPAPRSKTGRVHRIPLSGRALEILDAARMISDGGLVFPSPSGRPMHDSAISGLFKDLKLGCVPHGMRSSFRVWCAESGHSREIAEAALAHTVGGSSASVESAYMRSDLFERRRHLMEAWAGFLSGSVARVVQIPA